MMPEMKSTTVFDDIWTMDLYSIHLVNLSTATSTWLNPPSVAKPPELSRLKCAGHHHKGNIDSNALQTEQFLVCRVTSQYNHRLSDRTSIPRMKASPEILQPQVLQHRQGKDYKSVQTIITKPNLVKQLYKP